MDRIKTLYDEWNSLRPLKEEDEQRLRRKFVLEFNYNSNHIEGNTLTYGQTEMLLLFGKVADAANMKDLEDMKASNVALNMVVEQAKSSYPLTKTFVRQLHETLLREDYAVYRTLPGGQQTSYTVHAGIYKTRANSMITQTGERFDYASPEETPALMADLVNWYREEEQKAELSPIELASQFHYRYIRIHPFEDGNGRIARLLANYILLEHDFPMIVVKSADKDGYLNALSKCDGMVGTVPSEGAHASINQIKPLVEYMAKCLERALVTCIKAAKGQSIEEDEDFVKELRLLEMQKRQDIASQGSKRKFSADEVWNILEFVFFPIIKEFTKTLEATSKVFQFCQTLSSCQISKTQSKEGGLGLGKVDRDRQNSQIQEYVNEAKSMWFNCEMRNPRHPRAVDFTISKSFYIAFFDDNYFVDGILNKNFAYVTYPTEEERKSITSKFKQDILKELREKL